MTIIVSKFNRNTYSPNTSAYMFRSRPLSHYRRSYSNTGSSAVHSRAITDFTVPGGTTTYNGDKCLGLEYVHNVLLSKYSNPELVGFRCKRPNTNGTRYHSNAERLQSRFKTFRQNSFMSTTSSPHKNSISDPQLGNCPVTFGYSKFTNKKHASNAAVTSGQRILRLKVDTAKQS